MDGENYIWSEIPNQWVKKGMRIPLSYPFIPDFSRKWFGFQHAGIVLWFGARLFSKNYLSFLQLVKNLSQRKKKKKRLVKDHYLLGEGCLSSLPNTKFQHYTNIRSNKCIFYNICKVGSLQRGVWTYKEVFHMHVLQL